MFRIEGPEAAIAFSKSSCPTVSVSTVLETKLVFTFALEPGDPKEILMLNLPEC